MEVQSLQNLIQVFKPLVPQMIESNKKYSKLSWEKINIDNKIRCKVKRIHNLKSLITMINAEQISYSEGIKTVIKSGLQRDINGVLFEKTYGVELESAIVRGKNHTRVYLIDEEGRKLPPKTVEGDMLNQVLSFAAVVTLSTRNGCKFVFYDEAFASANVRSLSLIKKLMKYYIKSGINFVLVTQNPVLTYGLDRRVIYLESNGKSVTQVIQRDITGEEDMEEKTLYMIELFDRMNEGGIDNADFIDRLSTGIYSPSSDQSQRY